MLWVLKNIRILMILGSLVGLGGVYYYWKDSIEDTLLAQIQLQAMKEAEVYKQNKYAQAQELIDELHVKEREARLRSVALSNELERKSNEDSCIRKPLSADDVRVLNRLFSSDSEGTSTTRHDSSM